jgi:uncharacterized BrkB/YihY/UPF0761 family membrane protein
MLLLRRTTTSFFFFIGLLLLLLFLLLLLTAVGFIPNNAFQNDACTLQKRKKNGMNEYIIERK